MANRNLFGHMDPDFGIIPPEANIFPNAVRVERIRQGLSYVQQAKPGHAYLRSYGIRPDFIWIAGYPDGSTIPSSPLLWNKDGDCNTDNSPCYVALGQSTVLWQYAGDALIAGEDVDLDQGNPNLDFHTALEQYCPYP